MTGASPIEERTGIVPELFLRDVRGAARRGEHDEVARLLGELAAKAGQDEFYAEALSWAARAYLAKGFNAEAEQFAERAYLLAEELTGEDVVVAGTSRALALGAAIEVKSQLLVSAGSQDAACSYLREMEERHARQPFRIRIRKNLHTLDLAGQRALPIDWVALPGTTAGSDVLLGGTPYVLLFWAHWCSDSRHQARTLAKVLESESAPRLAIVAPTRLFGYITKGNPASEEAETAHMGEVLNVEYPLLRMAAVPFGMENIERYGASTFPTLVGVDRAGVVRFYHAGVMKPEAMAEALAPLGD